MTVTNTPYCTPQQLKLYIDERAPGADDTRASWAANAATAWIDDYCQRVFSSDDTASARVYEATDACLAVVDDFHTTTGLVVETDDADDGTFSTTWTSADYEVEPFNTAPFYRLRAVGSYVFPRRGRRRGRVRVTAQWGYPSVPAAVFQACLILGQEFHSLYEAKFGVAGFDGFGAVRLRDNQRVVSLLAPYRRVGGVG